MTNAYYLNQFISTTLSSVGGIDNSQTTGIKIASTSGVTTDKPGILCLSYSDPIDTTKAEWISYTSIDGTNELQGVTRGDEGFSAKAHSNGVTVAFPISRSHINNLNDALIIDDTETNLLEGILDEDDMASNSATKGVTQQSIKAYVDNNGLANGWTPANETWTYASATTITVPAGATAKYQKGDKFKLTANSVVLQGYIITVADTLLTVRGDALTNHTFTDNYYSKADNPQGFPQWFAWTPTFSGAISSIGNAAIVAAFQITGNVVHCRIKTTFGNTTSFTTGALRFTPPTTIFNAVGHFCGTVYFEDAATAGYTGFFQVGSTTVIGISAIATAGAYGGNSQVTNLVPMTWTTNDYFNGSFFYQMA